MPFCMVLLITALIRVGGLSAFVHGLPQEMKTIHVTGEFGWIYILSWTVMVSFGYNTNAMAQRYFSVDNERSARKVSLLCAGLFVVGAFLWFIPPMAMRIVYPDLHSVWPGVVNVSESSYAVASLTLLPHGLIGIMLAAMFSSTMANVGANFNVKSAILTKDIYQGLLRKNASDRELLIVGWVTTFLVGSFAVGVAAMMASTGQSVFSVMMTFNSLISLAYGPPALLGLVIRRAPAWSGLASFAVGIVLGILGSFVYNWTLIQQVEIIIPSSFGIFFLSMLFDRGDWPARAQLFEKLNTPVNVDRELKDSPDYTAEVFRFLSRTIAVIGGLSLLLLLTASGRDRATIFWFAAITLGISVLLGAIHGRRSSPMPAALGAKTESAG
jgi:Na+/proline symporter